MTKNLKSKVLIKIISSKKMLSKKWSIYHSLKEIKYWFNMHINQDGGMEMFSKRLMIKDSFRLIMSKQEQNLLHLLLNLQNHNSKKKEMYMTLIKE